MMSSMRMMNLNYDIYDEFLIKNEIKKKSKIFFIMYESQTRDHY